MELYIRKAKLTVLDKYEVTDSRNNKVFGIREEMISVGKRFRINDAADHEVATVYEKKLTVRDVYIIKAGTDEIDVFRIDTIRKVPEYRAKQLGWTLKGDFSRKDLKIMEGLHIVAHIKPRMLSFGEIIKIDVRNEKDGLPTVALYLASQMDQTAKPENAMEK